MLIVFAKFRRNLSIKCGDIASRGIDVNGRIKHGLTDGRPVNTSLSPPIVGGGGQNLDLSGGHVEFLKVTFR